MEASLLNYNRGAKGDTEKLNGADLINTNNKVYADPIYKILNLNGYKI